MSEFTRDEALAHFGVKGMKWGVRKQDASKTPLTGLGPSRITRTTKNGDVLTIDKNPPNKLNKVLAAMSENYRRSYNDGAYFTIRDSKGKAIGNGSLWKKSDTELYLNWVTIKSSARGKGYATEVLKAAKAYGAKDGIKKLTLEVPANAPDARHIYTKLGFKVIKEEINPNEPVWGGLTTMEYNFK